MFVGGGGGGSIRELIFLISPYPVYEGVLCVNGKMTPQRNIGMCVCDQPLRNSYWESFC